MKELGVQISKDARNIFLDYKIYDWKKQRLDTSAQHPSGIIACSRLITCKQL